MSDGIQNIVYLLQHWIINLCREVSQCCAAVNYRSFLVPSIKNICWKLQNITTHFNSLHNNIVMWPMIVTEVELQKKVKNHWLILCLGYKIRWKHLCTGNALQTILKITYNLHICTLGNK